MFAVQVLGLRQLKRELRAVRQPASRPTAIWVVRFTVALLLTAGGGGLLYGLTTPTRIGPPTPTLAGLVDALRDVDSKTASIEASTGGPAIPVLDLDLAGFHPVAVRRGARTLVVYEGRHGCRVGLTVLDSGEAARIVKEGRPPGVVTWEMNGSTFVLVTHGMEPERHARLAAAVALLVRGGDPGGTRAALVAASEGRTCLG